MKKFAKILSFALVAAMLALAFASCGTAAEEKVAIAMAKMASAKKTDISANITVKMDMGGTVIETPMTTEIKSDMTNEENPVVYAETTMTFMGEDVKNTVFYKDGYVYTEMGVIKVKTAMSYEDMAKEAEIGIDTTKIFEAKKDNIDESFVITENDDGSITVKMTVTEEEFASVLAEFSNELSASIGDGGSIEISDTVFEFTVDKDCNVAALNATLNMSLEMGGETVAVAYKMAFEYRTVGEDFEVPVPADLDSYVELSY